MDKSGTYSLIITAAGTGSRFDSRDAKQFVELCGKPLLRRTCEMFWRQGLFSYCVITARPSEKEKVKSLLSELPYFFSYEVIEGGSTRFESVKKAFYQLRQTDKVMIHDGARPLVSHRLIQRVIEAAKTNLVVIPGVPVTNTIKWVEHGSVKSTLPRDFLFTIQTPQAFDYSILDKAYHAFDGNDISDEAGLVERIGVPVSVVEGENENIKVTVKSDLEYARTFFTRL